MHPGQVQIVTNSLRNLIIAATAPGVATEDPDRHVPWSPDADRTDNGDIVAISSPNVPRSDVEKALDGWETWAELTADTVNLAQIGRRIRPAGRDSRPPRQATRSVAAHLLRPPKP